MGYQIGVSINAMKAVDYTDLAGVQLKVYLEGENFSIMTLTTDAQGHVYDNLDRSQYGGQDIGRLQVYYEKQGFGPGCAMLINGGDFLDGNNVKHYVFTVDLLLVGNGVEILPPPEMTLQIEARDIGMMPMPGVQCDICLPTMSTPFMTLTTGTDGKVVTPLTFVSPPSYLTINYSKGGVSYGTYTTLLSNNCYSCTSALVPMGP